LKILRERLNEYAVKYGLRDLLDVKEDVARRLAEAGYWKLSKFSGVNFGVKALAALIAYREYALGRRGVFGKAAWYWLEMGGSAWLLYYAPRTAYNKAIKASAEKPAAVEELVAEGLRRLFLKPGADRHRGFVEELTKGGRLALMFEKETDSSYVFRLYRLEEGGKFVELEGVKLRIEKVGEGEVASIVYALKFDDVERWRGFFKQELEVAMKAAEVVGERLPVEDRLPYLVGWVASDVAIRRKGNKRMLEMSTSHLWQLAETRALFDWSYVAVHGVNLTLEGPKPLFDTKTSLENLDNAIRISAEGGWLRMLSDREGLEVFIHVKSWDGLKRWVAEHWSIVVDVAVRRLGEEIRSELNALRDRLNDNKIAREAIAPALLLIQAERLGVNEATLRYLSAVASGAISGDGYVSAAMKRIELASGEREIALLWGAALAAHGIKAEVKGAGGAFQVAASGGGAARLAGLYFLFGPPLLEGDEKVINYKLAEAVELAAEGLDVSWEGLRRTEGGLVAADLTISALVATVKYNIYLRGHDILLQFHSADRNRAELAARLLKLVGVSTEIGKVGGRDEWYVWATTDRLAAGREELRKALAEIVRKAVENGWVEAEKAERWLRKLERGRMLKEGWPKYEIGLAKGALVVRFGSTSPASVEREAQRLRDMGLVEGVHFTVKMPEGGGKGYVSILKEGLERAAWLSVHGEGERQELAADFVEYILQRAEEEGEEVYEKAREIVEEGKARGSLTLKGFVKEVEVDGRRYVVKIIDGEAVEEDRGGRKLLRIKITAEVGRVEGEHTIVNRVVHEYTITFGRRGAGNEARGFAYAKADAPGGREADAERFAAVVKALTGREPWVYRMGNRIKIECGREHLDGFKRYTELADDIEKWLEETRR
jgi:DNA-binding transcriptional ArsR family regulator